MRPLAAGIGPALAVVAWLSSGTAVASQRAVTDVDLARTAAAAVRGRVEAVTTGWEAESGAIYTWVTIDVERAWGLDGPADRVTVKVLGGVVGGTGLVVGGQARFAVGERVFALLDVRPRDGTLSVAGHAQGKWTVSPSGGAAGATWHRALVDARVGADASTSTLDALAALVGTRSSAAGADQNPPRPVSSAPRVAQTRDTAAREPILGRWHQADDRQPVFVDHESSGGSSILHGGRAGIEDAAAVWRRAGSLDLQIGVSRGPRCFSNAEPADARISVTHGDPCGEIADASPILAIGGAYFSADDVREVGGRRYWRLTKGMVVTDDAPGKIDQLAPGCLADLLAHEIGHAIGLDHVSDDASIMSPSLSPTCLDRVGASPLSSADFAAVIARYPRIDGSAQPTFPPDTPSGLIAVSAGPSVTIAWTAPPDATTVDYEVHAGSRPGQSDLAVVEVASTILVAPTVRAGVYFVRVVARNAAGASRPTADLRVVVEPRVQRDRPFGQPVSVAWLPPRDARVPVSYLLYGGTASGHDEHVVPVSGPTLAVHAVAPGTYYIRVDAATPRGLRAMVPETRVVVPHSR